MLVAFRSRLTKISHPVSQPPPVVVHVGVAVSLFELRHMTTGTPALIASDRAYLSELVNTVTCLFTALPSITDCIPGAANVTKSATMLMVMSSSMSVNPRLTTVLDIAI